jgi:hypothetical protein
MSAPQLTRRKKHRSRKVRPPKEERFNQKRARWEDRLKLKLSLIVYTIKVWQASIEDNLPNWRYIFEIYYPDADQLKYTSRGEVVVKPTSFTFKIMRELVIMLQPSTNTSLILTRRNLPEKSLEGYVLSIAVTPTYNCLVKNQTFTEYLNLNLALN